MGICSYKFNTGNNEKALFPLETREEIQKNNEVRIIIKGIKAYKSRKKWLEKIKLEINKLVEIKKDLNSPNTLVDVSK